MSLYLKQIEQLISLQKVDDEIHSVKQELDNAPQELEALQSRFKEVSEERERQMDKMAHLHEQEKRLGIEIEDDAARLKKSKGKLMQVENTKEYHAMVREMDTLERMNKGREEEKTVLIEELTRQIALQEDVETRFAEAKELMDACEKNMQTRMSKAQAELDKLMKQRNETGREVPMPVFTRYEFIRERLAHPVIVPVEDGVCSGCHIAIPPQNYIELQKAAQILSCPNCQRLMFWDKHFTPEQ